MADENAISNTKIYEEFTRGTAFKSAIELPEAIKRCVLFEGGTQWNMDEDIEEYPKITLNIIRQIGLVRKSYVMENVYSYMVDSTNFQSVKKIQDFLSHLARIANLRRRDLKALSDDYTKGTAIGYFYWDVDKKHFLRKSGGTMRYEIIDVRKFVVSNAYIQDLQNQEYLIYNSYERISALKKKYDPDGKRDLHFYPDGLLYTSDTEVNQVAEKHEDEFVNVYTKFFRNEEGQVFFTVTTQYETLKKPTPLNPFYKGPSKQETESTMIPEELSEEEKTIKDISIPEIKSNETPTKMQDKRADYIWDLYPFVKLCLFERDNCFYGIPEALQYIEAQKSINNHYSVYDKALQDNVLGGYVFREGVLDETDLTAENGLTLKLKLAPGEPISNAFGRLPVASVPQDSEKYSQNLVGMTREVSGASRVQIGMSDFSGQSGKQTNILLQKAKENASSSALLFNEYKRDQAKIMFLFAKFYYDNEDFVIVEHGMQENSVSDYRGKNKFNGTDYLEDDVFIDIQVGSSPSFTEYTMVEMLGMMVQSGQLPFEVYLSLLPKGYLNNTDELIKLTKNNSNRKIEELTKIIEQQQQVMEQMSKGYESMLKFKEKADKIVKDNNKLREEMVEIQAKAIQRTQDASKNEAEVLEEMKNVMSIVQKQKK